VVQQVVLEVEVNVLNVVRPIQILVEIQEEDIRMIIIIRVVMVIVDMVTTIMVMMVVMVAIIMVTGTIVLIKDALVIGIATHVEPKVVLEVEQNVSNVEQQSLKMQEIKVMEMEIKVMEIIAVATDVQETGIVQHVVKLVVLEVGIHVSSVAQQNHNSS